MKVLCAMMGMLFFVPLGVALAEENPSALVHVLGDPFAPDETPSDAQAPALQAPAPQPNPSSKKRPTIQLSFGHLLLDNQLSHSPLWVAHFSMLFHPADKLLRLGASFELGLHDNPSSSAGFTATGGLSFGFNAFEAGPVLFHIGGEGHAGMLVETLFGLSYVEEMIDVRGGAGVDVFLVNNFHFTLSGGIAGMRIFDRMTPTGWVRFGLGF